MTQMGQSRYDLYIEKDFIDPPDTMNSPCLDLPLAWVRWKRSSKQVTLHDHSVTG